jgi:hypothetical protein
MFLLFINAGDALILRQARLPLLDLFMSRSGGCGAYSLLRMQLQLSGLSQVSRASQAHTDERTDEPNTQEAPWMPASTIAAASGPCIPKFTLNFTI